MSQTFCTGAVAFPSQNPRNSIISFFAAEIG